MSIPNIRPNAKELRSVRELLHQLGASNRLRSDPILSRCLIPTDDETACKTLAPSVEELIQSVLRRLPPRVRMGLERTEFHDQTVSEAAKSLGISERQLYRDRAFAFRIIAGLLSSHPTDHVRPRVEIRDRTDVRLSHARMLEQVGQLDAAATVLADLALATDNATDRASTFCALTRLALEQGNLHGARSYADHAISSTFACGGDAFARCEADSVLGEIALRHGRPDAATQVLRRAAIGLRALLGGSQHDRATVALARCLIALTVSHHLSGRFREAWDAITETRSRLSEMSRPDYLSELDARVLMAATSHFIGETPAHAESELRACYEISLNSGFILSALDIAVYLATFYRLRGATDLAIELMRSVVGVCNGVSISRTKAYFYIAFATVLCRTGEVGLGAEMLARGSESTLPGQPDVEAQLHLATTRAKLAAQAPLEAMEASARAAVIFTELGRTGLVGVSLHLRSLALISLGRHREAFQTALDAVDALSSAHPRARILALETLHFLQSPNGGRRHRDSVVK